MKILYQGTKGAYSQLAALEVYSKAETISCKTFEECFKKCSDDESLKTIIPVENSIAGRVADTQYLMNKYKLQIYAEHFHAKKTRNERRAQFCRLEFDAKNLETFCNECTNTCSFAQKKKCLGNLAI